LGVTEITTDLEFYDYQAKYSQGGSRHILPAQVSDRVSAQCLELAVKAHQALGCRGVSRTDFRYDDTGAKPRLILLETNTQPGMTPTSLVPEQAAHVGIPYPKLCRWLVEDASCDR
jgi:D-alanine-D-alanine ligase